MSRTTNLYEPKNDMTRPCPRSLYWWVLAHHRGRHLVGQLVAPAPLHLAFLLKSVDGAWQRIPWYLGSRPPPPPLLPLLATSLAPPPTCMSPYKVPPDRSSAARRGPSRDPRPAGATHNGSLSCSTSSGDKAFYNDPAGVHPPAAEKATGWAQGVCWQGEKKYALGLGKNNPTGMLEYARVYDTVLKYTLNEKYSVM